MSEKTKRKLITVSYYDKNDKQKKQYINYIKNKIRKGDNSILKNMMGLVEQHVKNYHADFYVHDVHLYKQQEGDPFIWIVRDYGTHFIDLCSEKFLDNEVWDAKSYFHAILFNSKKEIKGIFLIENGEIKKLTEDTVLAVLKKKEDVVREKLRLLKV